MGFDFNTGVLATDVIGINSGPDSKVFHNVRQSKFHHHITDSKATMGLNASRLLAIDLLKRLHRGGKVALTETDYFDDNGNFDNEMFEDFLIQEDGNEELMRKARIDMSYAVGQSVKREREVLLEAEREFMSAQKKSRVSRPIWYTDQVTGQQRCGKSV